MAVLTESEKSKVRYHLGYLAAGFAASLQFGLPRPVQTVFMVEEAMNNLVEVGACNMVRQIICTLDGIEESMKQALTQLAVEQVGNVKMRGDVCDRMEKEYNRWASRLADILGVPKYAFSERSRKSGPGSNIRVSG